MRWIGMLGIVGALGGATSAHALEASSTCPGLAEDFDAVDTAPARGDLLLLTESRCEDTKSQELRATLMRIPQEKEDPMELSFGVKNSGGMLRLKIPFSF